MCWASDGLFAVSGQDALLDHPTVVDEGLFVLGRGLLVFLRVAGVSLHRGHATGPSGIWAHAAVPIRRVGFLGLADSVVVVTVLGFHTSEGLKPSRGHRMSYISTAHDTEFLKLKTLTIHICSLNI